MFTTVRKTAQQNSYSHFCGRCQQSKIPFDLAFLPSSRIFLTNKILPGLALDPIHLQGSQLDNHFTRLSTSSCTAWPVREKLLQIPSVWQILSAITAQEISFVRSSVPKKPLLSRSTLHILSSLSQKQGSATHMQMLG